MYLSSSLVVSFSSSLCSNVCMIKHLLGCSRVTSAVKTFVWSGQRGLGGDRGARLQFGQVRFGVVLNILHCASALRSDNIFLLSPSFGFLSSKLIVLIKLKPSPTRGFFLNWQNDGVDNGLRDCDEKVPMCPWLLFQQGLLGNRAKFHKGLRTRPLSTPSAPQP